MNKKTSEQYNSDLQEKELNRKNSLTPIITITPILMACASLQVASWGAGFGVILGGLCSLLFVLLIPHIKNFPDQYKKSIGLSLNSTIKAMLFAAIACSPLTAFILPGHLMKGPAFGQLIVAFFLIDPWLDVRRIARRQRNN